MRVNMTSQVDYVEWVASSRVLFTKLNENVQGIVTLFVELLKQRGVF